MQHCSFSSSVVHFNISLFSSRKFKNDVFATCWVSMDLSDVFLYIQIQEVQACFTYEILYRNLSLLLSKISQIQKFLKSFHFWRNCNKKAGVILRVISFLKVVVAFFALFTLSGIAALKLTPCQICIDWVCCVPFKNFSPTFPHCYCFKQVCTFTLTGNSLSYLKALFNVLQCKNIHCSFTLGNKILHLWQAITYDHTVV